MWGMGWGEVLPRPHLLGAEVKLIPGILGWKEKGNIYITVPRSLFFLRGYIKGARAASLSQSTTLHSTGNTPVWTKEVGHSNTRGTLRALFFPAQIYCCTIVYISNILWRLKVNPFIFISSFSWPCCVQAMFSLNCLKVTISEFLYNLLLVSYGDNEIKKK